MPLEYFRARMQANQNILGERRSRGNEEILPALPPFQGNPPDITAIPPPDPNPGLLGNVLKIASLTFEPLRRGTQAFRETILWGNGEYTTEGWKRRVKGALNGKVRMSNKEFGQILLGREKWEAMERTPWMPGWAAPLMEPEAGVVRKVKSGMRFSLADLWSLGADLWADPTTYLALTPVGAVGKIGAFVNRIPVAGKMLTFPFRAPTKLARRMFSPASENPLAYVFNLARQPEDVLPRPIFEKLKIGADDWFNSLDHAWLAHKELVGKRLKYASLSDQKIGKALWTGSTRGLDDGERVLYDNISTFVQTHLTELELKRPGVLAELGLKEGEHLRLDVLYPAFAGKQAIPIDIWQSWSAENIGKVWLGLSKKQAAGKGLKEIDVAGMDLNRFSAIDSVRDLLYTIKKKEHLEPEMLRFAPKPGGRHLEDPLTAQMTSIQRRYYTDVVNAFTGNARGRKEIEFDYKVAEFWEKQMANPNGPRVMKMFQKLGFGTTRDGLPDFSTTSKLAGMWTGSIVQNILGLRLKSAMVNSTQTLNFAISRGLPATIKGMFKFASPEFRSLRKQANLLGDYKALFNEDMWLRGFGKTWSDVLMGPFNAMENIIRGTGFHVGLDDFLKKNKVTLKQAMANPVMRKKMIEHAHFESMNGAFVYGTLGRPPWASKPLLRPAAALLSFPFKQGEFLRREFVKDGGAVLRFLGLHGWLIQRSNEWIGVAAEDFLGWGFKPMTRSFGGIPLLTSPPTQFLLDLTEGLGAVGDGDWRTADKKFAKVKEMLPILFSPIRFPWLQWREVVGTTDVHGIRLDPTASRSGLIQQWQSKRKEIGEGFVPIARNEVIANAIIGRSTTQKARSDLKGRINKAIKKRDGVLYRRVGDWVKALEGHDGDALGKATWELVQPIEIEGQNYYPEPDQVMQRIEHLYQKKLVSDDILSMMENQFLQQIFIMAQLELLDKVGSQQR